MAISLGVSARFLFTGETPSPLAKRSFSVRFLPTPVAVSANQRMATLAAALSKPAAAETKKREPRGIMKPRRVSPEMQAFLGGVSEIPRTQALKQIWAYIKQYNLQDPENKKVIVCDEQLKKIFGARDRVGFLEIAGLLNPHFLK